MKFTLSVLVALCSFFAMAEELFAPKVLTDFQKHSLLKCKDGVFSAAKIKGGTFFASKSVKIDPTKKYQISGEFKSTGKRPMVYIGFVPYDAKNKQISCIYIHDSYNSLTTLAKDAKKGDKVLYLTDCSKWRKDTPHGYIAFNAKKDYSDMPNTSVLAIEKDIAKKDNLWVVTLKQPLKKDYAAKTSVRQHVATSSFIYPKYSYVGNQWTKLNGVVFGMAQRGAHGNKFWPKTAFIRPIVLVGQGDATTQLEFKNFKLEIVK